MTESVNVYAGECTITHHTETDSRSQRGRVVVVHKPDGTVLVHDAAGYQPVEWLTRADAVHREQGPDGAFALVAVDGDERLRVESHGRGARASHDATAAGTPAGTCPRCDGVLVRARSAVTCLDCASEYGIPRDAALLDSTCDCGLPRMAVERGARFELCVDRTCEDLDAAVGERFDREWSCPDCGGDLRVLRERTLFLGCESYPDCEETFALPDREVVGDCECGLPTVEAEGEQPRCLDADCTESASGDPRSPDADSGGGPDADSGGGPDAGSAGTPEVL
ncbi:endonuclease NucS [Halorussus salilacus]|uniref:topoisomerase DNA-binding C4 zinc finger domain-containing protein n=1 Tax=Halorussus salilacus TaxID=2953750 RepID=UPI0020A1934A|nr:topoisomerase DNA-binding C4 zinc finger domain-containing protein [Halorussus salilacus]USZ66754.1 endonuclease NucS [Halorussus salilacus]